MFFFMKNQNEEEKEQLLSLKKRDADVPSASSSSIRFFTKVTACAVLLAGIGTLGKINVYDRQQQRFESSGVKQQLAFLGEADGLPSCGPYVDDNLRTKLLHNGEEVQDARSDKRVRIFFQFRQQSEAVGRSTERVRGTEHGDHDVHVRG